MKIKSDFVTNSSSSSFIFVFRGVNQNDLFQLIKKYQEIFNLTEDWSYGDVSDIRSVDYMFVIHCLKKYLEGDGKIKTIDILLKDLEDNVKYWEKDLRKEKLKQKKSKDYDNYRLTSSKQYLKEAKIKLQTVKDAVKNKGLDHFLEVGFGDSHGDFHGEKPSVLDYNRDNLELEKDDLCIITESCH